MSASRPEQSHLSRARFWAFGGVLFALLQPAIALGWQGWRILAAERMSAPEWTALVVIVVAFVYGEGVRALARRWVPFVLSRIREMDRETSHISLLLAPLHAAGLVGAERSLAIRCWLGVAAIIAAVIIVGEMPDPWRGMVDLGVAGALLVGSAALVTGFREMYRGAIEAHEQETAAAASPISR